VLIYYLFVPCHRYDERINAEKLKQPLKILLSDRSYHILFICKWNKDITIQTVSYVQ